MAEALDNMDFLEQRWRECDEVNDDGALLKFIKRQLSEPRTS